MGGGGWVIAAIVLPLTTGVLALLVGRRGAAVAGVLGSVGGVAVALALAACVLIEGEETVMVGGWAVPLGIALRADGLAVAMLLTTAVVGSGVAVYARAYFSPAWPASGLSATRNDRDWLFWPVWLFAWGALNALYLSGDLFNLYVTLELLGLAAVALVALAGGDAAAAALRYLLLALLGSMLYILGVELIYATHQTLDLQQLRDRIEPGLSVGLAAALITGGLLVKTAIFPLHTWLPPAHGEAPAPVSAVLSALVVKAGFYLLARLWLDVFDALPWHAAPAALGALGAGAVLWGGLQAIRQQRLKPMIAYSTVAQLGYLLLALHLAVDQQDALTAAVLLAASHAAAKASLFLCTGSLLAAYGHDRIDGLSGISARMPVTAAAFALAALSLVGLPPTGGFVGKFILVESALRAGAGWVVAVTLAGSLLAAMFLFHALSRAFVDDEAEGASEPACGARVSIPAVAQGAALVLALLAVALGFVAGPLHTLLSIGVRA